MRECPKGWVILIKMSSQGLRFVNRILPDLPEESRRVWILLKIRSQEL